MQRSEWARTDANLLRRARTEVKIRPRKSFHLDEKNLSTHTNERTEILKEVKEREITEFLGFEINRR